MHRWSISRSLWIAAFLLAVPAGGSCGAEKGSLASTTDASVEGGTGGIDGSIEANVGGSAGDSGTGASGGTGGIAGGGGSSGQDGGGSAGQGGEDAEAEAGLQCPDGGSPCGADCVDLKTDKANCGACGHSCQGSDCKVGNCQPIRLYEPNSSPTLGAINGEYLFWSTPNDGTATRAKVDGSSSPLENYSPIPNPGAPTADNSSLFVPSKGALIQFQQGTTTSTDTYGNVTSGTAANAAVSGNWLYWCNAVSNGAVFSAQKGSTITVKNIGTGEGTPSWVAANSKAVFWVTPGSAQECNGVLYARANGADLVQTLAFTLCYPNRIVANETHVFVNARRDVEVSAVDAVAISGGQISLAKGLVNNPAVALAVDASNLYWGTKNGGLRRVPVGGGEAETIYNPPGEVDITGMVVSNCCIYYSIAGPASVRGIWKIAK